MARMTATNIQQEHLPQGRDVTIFILIPIQDVLNGVSPKKKHDHHDHFRASDPNEGTPECMKKMSANKMAELRGTGHVKHLDCHELKNQEIPRYGSPDKQARVDAIFSSKGMLSSLNYQDNDPSYSLVVAKPSNQPYVKPGKNEQRESWRPKTSLQWVHPYRTPLSL